jgi:hypothetical protein
MTPDSFHGDWNYSFVADQCRTVPDHLSIMRK